MGEDERVNLNPLVGVRNTLGEPYYENESVLLYLGDTRELMARLRGTVEIPLTVTSPPYNIGKEYEHPLPLSEYLDWCGDWFKDVWDLTAPSGAFWLNLGYVAVPGRAKALPLPYLLWDRLPFYIIQEIVWNYGAGVAARHSLSPRNEKWLWCVKDEDNYYFDLDAIRDPDVKYPNQKKNGRIKVNSIGKNPSDVWTIAKVTSGAGRSSRERAPHPAQFPMQLIERIVLGMSARGQLIFDPFMGSGTVGEVGMRNGRVCLGFEIDERYMEFAAKRLEAARDDMAALLPLAVDG